MTSHQSDNPNRIITDDEIWPAEYLASGRPPRSLKVPWLMHVEVTTRCPLACPQCYVKELGEKDIAWQALSAFIREAGSLGVRQLALSGGEPLSYPNLVDAVRLAQSLGIETAMATSGVGLTVELADELAKAGIGSIWLSLNGSREEIHSLSRTCFSETLAAAELLRSCGHPFHINWVARQDNTDDLPDLVDKVKALGASSINVLMLKPDATHSAGAVLSGKAFFRLAEFLRQYDDQSLPIGIESCYSALRLAVYGPCFIGIEAGCGAGRNTIALDVDGNLRPCRHLDYPESGKTIHEYWYKSKTLYLLRATEDTVSAPCSHCSHLANCRSCRAKSIKLYGDISNGDRQCPVALATVTRVFLSL